MASIWYILGVITTVWVIYDVWAIQKKMEQTNKILWTIAAVIPFLTFITAIAYYLMVKRK
jgi:hypothetical protein